MKEDEIKKNLEDLKKLYESSTEERALSSYIISVIRLLNGMAQIMNGGFHRYERIILENSVELFCNHFKEQVQCAINCVESVERKNEIIMDIEDAVMQIAQVYKNVVDSTANADKRMFMSLAVDTSLYEFSPKLCGLYAFVLQRLVKLYDVSGTRQQDYAFLIHPTLENNIKAKVLFKKRENSGKVVVVYIPVNILDQTDLVPVIALHEAFHVLTKKERERKRRAELLMKVALMGIGDQLFVNVTLCVTDRNLDLRRKSELMEVWFGNIRDEFMRHCDQCDEDNRCWYSENVLQDITQKLINGLKKVIEYLQQGELATLYMCDDESEFGQCVEEYERMREQGKNIWNNAYEMIIGDVLYQMLNRYMRIFREAYADVACIVTARLSPELYDKAFECSIQFKMRNNDFEDVDREMRRMLVYDTIIVHSDNAFSQMWSKNKKNNYEKNPNFGNPWYFNENILKYPRQKWINYDKIPMIYQDYFFYLSKCFGNLKSINQNPGIRQFRDKLNNITANRDKDFLAILGGHYEN